MNRNYLIVGLCIGLVLGLSVTAGVTWFFMRQQAARTSAAEARAAAMQAEQQARRTTRDSKAPLAIAPVPAPSPNELDGTWQVVSLRNSRGEATGEALKGLGFQFQGEKLTMLESNAKPIPAVVRVDPFANPKEIDIIAPTTDGQEKARLAIYRIDQGRVFIATDQRNPARRPKGYITGPNSGIEVMTLERVP